MIVVKTEYSVLQKKIYYSVNYVRDGIDIAVGKRLEIDEGSHPMVVLRGLHQLLNTIETECLTDEVCLRG